MALPRGIRNFNPGNIERTSDRWLGMADDQLDSRFITFKSPEYGIRAMLRLLINYQERHGLNTLREIINRWAPPIDVNERGEKNAQPTSAYVRHVALQSGFKPDAQINMLDRDTALAVVKAMIIHENGSPMQYQREQWYDDKTYDKALVLAGFEPVDKPTIKSSRTIAGSVTAGIATVGGAINESIPAATQQAAEAAAKAGTTWPEIAKWVFVGVALVGIIAAIAARVSDQKKRIT